MKEYIKDYFALTDEEKFNKVKTICLNLFEQYIDTSSEYNFNESLYFLLQRVQEDIEFAEMIEDYEVCEVGKKIIKIFNDLKY